FTITLDALSYCRYRNPGDKYEPHRKLVALFTNYFPNSRRTESPYFVDVTKQFDIIMDVLDIYAEAYGEWRVKEYITSQLIMYGRMAGVKYAEAFNKIIWRTALPYLF
ncbi:MAG: hypothetical protein DRO63_05275, partial [Candidatus Gerdarchaeota archaeon]